MRAYRSIHLQKNLGVVLASAEAEPVVLLNRGQPTAVVMSAHEFKRLKQAVRGDVTHAVLPRLARTIRIGSAPDPLGCDTTDFWACVQAMTADMLAGTKAASALESCSRPS